MKVFVDENLSPALARALAALFAGEHQILHIRERYGPGVTDLQWISELSREGGWVVISGDRRIRRNKAEFNAFQASRLTGFFLSAGLCKAPLVKQAERILALWSGIETFAERAKPARCSSFR
ncbi:hypothetical protein MKK65_16980 [Methylobacterium sp. J-001]|uniref:DUF5615 family PIN-like protein n=1 Tax=Methylobacterium sp. J-001 TaxID=2836609 RepID=UPI001FBB172C|nr:DUF5615 family PIN-like protein [Methylobacterium sp. J-001]MCJ2118241.1 hypothetical protein [Methylobacterium sp. J-001]